MGAPKYAQPRNFIIARSPPTFIGHSAEQYGAKRVRYQKKKWDGATDRAYNVTSHVIAPLIGPSLTLAVGVVGVTS
jgi:hypothetical protein